MSTRVRKAGAWTAVAAFVAAWAVVLSGGGGPAAGTAHLWWDQDGGSCVRHDPPAAYSDEEACLPPSRTSPEGSSMLGWDNAQDGDTILVVDEPGGDDYGDLTIGPEGKSVTIRAASGRPEFALAVVSCDNCSLDGLTFEYRGGGIDADEFWVCNEAGHSNSLRGIVAMCGSNADLLNFEVDGRGNPGGGGVCPPAGVNISVAPDASASNGPRLVSGEIHGIVDGKAIDGGMSYGLVDGVNFYDITRPNACAPDVHNECVWLGTVDHTTIRNSRFVDCPTQAILVSDLGTPNWDGFTLENNVFTRSTNGGPGTGWHVSPTGIRSGIEVQTGWTVRYNTFETVPDMQSVPGSSGNQWYGNLGGAACGLAGWTYRHNVGQTCGGEGSVPTTPPFNTASQPGGFACWADAPANDFHLAVGCPAVGAGDPASFPVADADGVPRGSPPDAGAYEAVP